MVLCSGWWWGGGGLIEHKTCFHFVNNFCLKHFSLEEEFSEISQMYLGLHVK